MNTWQPTGFSAGEFARMQQDAEREKEDLQKLLEESREEKQRIEAAMEAADAEHRLAVETAQAIQPGEGITLPLAAALAWLLR